MRKTYTIKVHPGYSKIVHLEFTSKKDLALCFLRYQEHFESPNHKFVFGPFTVTEFKKWYTKKYGKWDYYTEWCGFNLPDRVIESIRNNSEWEPLSKLEMVILDATKNLIPPYYVVGYIKGDDSTRNHEMSHAMMYMYPSYRASVSKILKGKGFTKLIKYLLSVGYCNAVLKDEVHAYLMWEHKILKKDANIDKNYFPGVVKKLKENFWQYIKT